MDINQEQVQGIASDHRDLDRLAAVMKPRFGPPPAEKFPQGGSPQTTTKADTPIETRVYRVWDNLHGIHRLIDRIEEALARGMIQEQPAHPSVEACGLLQGLSHVESMEMSAISRLAGLVAVIANE